MQRRQFLVGGAAGLGLLAIPGPLRANEPPRIKRKSTLGRTGMEISDISFGSSRTGDPDVVRYAYDRGINYFDTAESYAGGSSEEAIGEALQGGATRCVLTSKTGAGASTKRAELMRALEASLRRLKTDHVDVYFNHAVNDVARLKNPEWHEFVARREEAGQDPLLRHVRSRRQADRVPRLRDRRRISSTSCSSPTTSARIPRSTSASRAASTWSAIQPDLPRVLAKAKRKTSASSR